MGHDLECHHFNSQSGYVHSVYVLLAAGRMPPIWFPMFIGGKGCGVCDRGFFNGFMDSVSLYVAFWSLMRQLH